jgi:hypothetical protein
MKINLTDEESTVLIGELDRIIREDRFFLSPRIRTLPRSGIKSDRPQFPQIRPDAPTRRSAARCIGGSETAPARVKVFMACR